MHVSHENIPHTHTQTHIIPGTKQLLLPSPPTDIGPFAHSCPSALESIKKNLNPTGCETISRTPIAQVLRTYHRHRPGYSIHVI